MNQGEFQKIIEKHNSVLESIYGFASEKIIPLLANSQDLSRAEKALEVEYGQIYVWTEILVNIEKDPLYFGIILSAARTIFELYLDIQLLRKKNTNDVEKFYKFAQVNPFRAADKIVNIAMQEGIPLDEWFSSLKNRIDEPSYRKEIECTAKRLWGTNKKGNINWPNHWSSMNRLQIARQVGSETLRLYLQIYGPTSWSIHAHPTLVVDKPVDYLHNLVAVGYATSSVTVVESTRICIEQISTLSSQLLLEFNGLISQTDVGQNVS